MITLGFNTYCLVDAASEYITQFGLTALTNAESSLIRATAAIDRIYANRFIGKKQTIQQVLQWPRMPSADCVDYSEGLAFVDSFGNLRDYQDIPSEVSAACVELAVMLEAGVDIYSQPAPAIKSITEKIDVITSQTEYGTSYRADPLYKISLILAPLLTNTSNIKLVR